MGGGALLGDLAAVERLQAGIREWVFRTARSHRHLGDIDAAAVLPLLCAAAFGPVLSDAADVAGTAAVARIGVLSSVEADVLAQVLTEAAKRAWSAHASGEAARQSPQREIDPTLRAETSPRLQRDAGRGTGVAARRRARRTGPPDQAAQEHRRPAAHPRHRRTPAPPHHRPPTPQSAPAP